jgi:hypothetical protein
VSETLTHARNCGWHTVGGDGDCTCGLEYRIQLQTEQTMSAAWRKRAEEAEAEIERLRDTVLKLTVGIDAVQLDTCTQRDWDLLNEIAREATR